MAWKTKGSIPDHNRADFIRNHLAQNPDASVEEIAKAWADAGKPPELTPTRDYVATIRRFLGRKNKEASPTFSRARRFRGGKETPDSISVLEEIERSLDNAFAEAKKLGDEELAELIRMARRRATRKIVLAERKDVDA